MSKYVCSICGFIYDEAKGIPGSGIAPGTAFEDLPDDWTCPLCGATKAEFNKLEKSEVTAPKKEIQIEATDDIKELTPLEISIICSNLARGCEKQYKAEETAMFTELALFFKSATPQEKEPSVEKLIELIDRDLDVNIPNANNDASDPKDRGALRALVWSEKVTRILKSLLSRYQKEGDSMLQDTGVYVCTICGFIYVGDNLPSVCPVCKVPNWKFEKVEGGA